MKHVSDETKPRALQLGHISEIEETVVYQFKIKRLLDDSLRELHQIGDQVLLHVERCPGYEIGIVLTEEHIVVSEYHLVDE